VSALAGRCGSVAAGLLLDRLAGEPPAEAHPVAWFGRLMEWLEERIWAGIRAPGESAVWEWAAFGLDGTHAGSILLPAEHLLQAVRGGRIYVLSHDEMDVPSIQAYRLKAPET